jgi:hypothetical protein
MVDDVFAGDQTGKGVFDTLVGDGKKFDNAEALAAGKLKADEHISTIEQENATLKEQLAADGSTKEKETKMSDLLDAIKEANAKEGSEGGQTMSTEELEQLVRKVVAGDRGIETKDSNRAKGNELVLKLVDGNVEAARQLVTERGTALGMSPEAMRDLSEQSPSAFAALISPDKSTASSGDLSILPSVNTDVLNGNAAPLEVDGFKTKAWFNAKKTEVGHVKYLNDQSIQRELTRSMNGLGERFNN